MAEPADFTREDQNGISTLALLGALTVDSIGPLDRRLRAVSGRIARIDLGAVSHIDTIGAWVVWRAANDYGAEIAGASPEAARLIAAVKGSDSDAPIAPGRPVALVRVLASVGDAVVGLGRGAVSILSFLGALLIALGTLLRHPGRLRMNAVSRQIELVGIDSLSIIGLMSFLIGITIAQQGAVQLAQFGAQIYTINLTGRLATRELGILMTAIMLAGRSGSAFAAQIGTMELTEEVDAMRTIGIAPMEALVVPRVLASVLMMPLLGFYSTVIAIIGGATISSLVLDIPFMTFLSRIQEVVPARDMVVGLSKGPVFGLIIAIAGCYQGMCVKGNSEAVGRRTTLAVVQAIFMVIVVDAIFAVFYSEIGWT